MQYAVVEILLFLVASAVLGGLFGFVLCRAISRHEVERRVEQSHRTHTSEVSQVRARLDERNVEIVGLNDQLAETQGRMRAMEAEIEAHEDAGPGRQNQLADLTAELEDANVRSKAAESANNRAAVDADDARRHLAVAEARVAELETASVGLGQSALTTDGRDQAIEELEAQLAGLRAKLAAEQTSSDGRQALKTSSGSNLQDEVLPDAFPAQLTIDVPAETSRATDQAAKAAAVAARTRGNAKVVHDDLTRISGIGPKIGATLAELGITSFRQIANFTKADIGVISDAIGAFPDRIERDDWMSAAQALHQAKYEGPPEASHDPTNDLGPPPS